MRLFHRFDYTLEKKDTMKVIFERIEKILTEYRKQDAPNYFYFSDYRTEGRVSAVQRIVKKFPELSKFEIEIEEQIGDEKLKYKALSNLPLNYGDYTM
ncbi:hypothetical protein J5Y03_09270 [Bacillus sp. RG28]|uniref:Uncharacterized protein n=1 Tax=Gottfriedia endophytica TaxID=2820819 RepID=A0A940NMM5_9BACI|nr:hypothetical protein [Gottfriedia endophytica]MBP0725376.1 hypothetical protein [Gottfriedia endophytica]